MNEGTYEYSMRTWKDQTLGSEIGPAKLRPRGCCGMTSPSWLPV